MKLRRIILLQFATVVCLALSLSAQTTRDFKLEPLSPKFLELIGADAKLETVATGFGFTEGPMWDTAGFLYVSDETINKIFRVNRERQEGRSHRLGRPGRQYLRSPASPDRLCERPESPHRGNSRREVQRCSQIATTENASTVPTM